jgi:hypothetical protein
MALQKEDSHYTFLYLTKILSLDKNYKEYQRRGVMIRKNCLILMLFLLISCSLAVKEPKVPPADLFQGVWVNEDSNTRGITKLDITQEGPKLFVHV